MSEKWDRHFLGLALHHSRLSKDPSTRVGSVIVGPDRELLSAGFNGFPRGIADTEERLVDRETKMKLIVHAEMNALLAAARTGMRLKGCTLYLCATDDRNWPEIPRVHCPYCDVDVAMVTFIDRDKTRPKRDPGRCYIRAGFRRCKGETKGGLVCVHIGPDELPEAQIPSETQMRFA